MDVWRALPEGPLFRSARLDCALARLHGALICEWERETLLALPYDEEAPFPLPELFCLARVDGAASSTGWMRKNPPRHGKNKNYVYHLGKKYAILTPTNEEKRGPAR